RLYRSHTCLMPRAGQGYNRARDRLLDERRTYSLLEEPACRPTACASRADTSRYLVDASTVAGPSCATPGTVAWRGRAVVSRACRGQHGRPEAGQTAGHPSARREDLNSPRLTGWLALAPTGEEQEGAPEGGRGSV